jgi:hypothetical protein
MRKENLSEDARIKRNEYSRKYKEKQRREAGVPVRKLTNPKFDPEKLYTWVDRVLVLAEVESDNGKRKHNQLFLNGQRLDREDADFLRHARNGATERLTLERVDRLAVKYDLPLWELEEYASRYNLDRRTKRRRKNASRANPTNTRSTRSNSNGHSPIALAPG